MKYHLISITPMSTLTPFRVQSIGQIELLNYLKMSKQMTYTKWIC